MDRAEAHLHVLTLKLDCPVLALIVPVVSYHATTASSLLRLREQLLGRLPLVLQFVEIVLRRSSGQLLFEECDFAIELFKFISTRWPCLVNLRGLSPNSGTTAHAAAEMGVWTRSVYISYR